MSNKKTITVIIACSFSVIILILFKLEIFRYDQINKGGYEELIKTNKITGVSYILTDNGWETKEDILKRQNDDEIDKYNKEIDAFNKKIELAEQILNNQDEHTESIEYYNAGYDYNAARNNKSINAYKDTDSNSQDDTPSKAEGIDWNKAYESIGNTQVSNYSYERSYILYWEDMADSQIYAIIGIEDAGYYMKKGFSFEDAVLDKINNYKNEISEIKLKIEDLNKDK